jgi:dTDP-4-amino-4,6-dideoxygalactose transaminase
MTRIPHTHADLAGNEISYVIEALKSGRTAGDHNFSRLARQEMQRLLGGGTVLLTPSCTAALDLAALLVDVHDGDEVIMPSYTFASTANAFVLRGARPVFVDIRPDTLNLDERLVEAAVTARTKAIVPVHYASVPCEMDSIVDIASRHRLLVVEDAAQAFLASYHDRPLGAIGDIGCFSFHETKTFQSGEGGAIFIRDRELGTRAEIIREKGTNRVAFMRGEVAKYTWVDVGSSYLASDITAAIMLAQIEARDRIIDARRALYDRYTTGLAPLLENGLVRAPTVPPGAKTNYHLFYLLMNDRATRDAFIERLAEHQITAPFHYIPLHSSPFAKARGWCNTLPITDSVAQRLVRLPLFNSLSEDQQDRVIKIALDFFGLAKSRSGLMMGAGTR